MARNKKTTTQVESIKHKDKRANIPTEAKAGLNLAAWAGGANRAR